MYTAVFNFINLCICNLCLHLALFGDIILIVLLRILNCCVDPVPVRNDYFGGGVYCIVYVCHCHSVSVYYDLFHMTGCVS